MSQRKDGFTLVELLVVIAIITLLISILLPAVQSAREAGRRTACLNNIKQLQLAIVHYESGRQEFPPGAMPSGAIWSAFILPYIEETSLYDSLNLIDLREQDNEADKFGERQWFKASDNLNGTIRSGNMAAIKQQVSLFLCPSSSAEWITSGAGVASVGPEEKLQPNYVACGSSVITEDDKIDLTADKNKIFNGAFTFGEGLEGRRFVDGLSKTIFLGEVDYRGGGVTQDTCQRAEPNNGCRQWGGRLCIGAKKDHAFLGSDDIDLQTDMSEFFCSTAIAPNQLRHGSSCVSHCSPASAAFELAYSSPHRELTLFSFGDGSARFIHDDVDPRVFRAFGSRFGSEVTDAADQ